MSGDAKTAFIAYLLCMKILPTIIGWTGGLFIAKMVLSVVKKLVDLIPSDVGEFHKDLRDLMGVGRKGRLIDEERRCMLQKVRYWTTMEAEHKR
jgi:hypothetical protein